MKRFLGILFVIIALSFSACGRQAKLATLGIGVGKELVIDLETDHAGGFKWSAAKPVDGDILELARFEYADADKKDRLIFRALRHGRTLLHLEYGQEGARPVKHKKFIVLVN